MSADIIMNISCSVQFYDSSIHNIVGIIVDHDAVYRVFSKNGFNNIVSVCDPAKLAIEKVFTDPDHIKHMINSGFLDTYSSMSEFISKYIVSCNR